jgi:NitT/TauT family transport system substrate-binding protein
MTAVIVSAWLIAAGWIGSPAAQEKVTWYLDWVFYSEHVPFFATKDFGYFKKEGLDVKIERGFGSGDTIKRIAAKAAPLGFADVGSLIIARSRGAKVKEVAMYYAKAPMAIWHLKSKGYKHPKDLAGARLGGPEGDAAWKVFPAFANANGLDPKTVSWTTLGYGAMLPGVLTGKLDAIPIFADEQPNFQAAARKAGKDSGMLRFSEWGVDIYANGIIAHDDTIRNNPGLLKRFVRASIDAWGHCMVYMDKCLKNFLKYSPTSNPKVVGLQYHQTRKLNIDQGVIEHGLGYMDPGKMDRTVDIITKYTPLKVRVKTDDVYTNAFLPQMAK